MSPSRITAVLVAVAVAVSTAAVASAADEPVAPPPDSVAATLDAVDAVPTPETPTVPLEWTPDGYRPELGDDIDVRLPTHSSESISIVEGGDDVGISIPGREVSAEIVSAGEVVYPDVTTDTSVLTRALDDGAVQVVAVMKSADASPEQRYDLDLPAGALLESTTDGGVRVIVGDAEIGSFEQPWAFDATGRELRTRYEIDGNTLVQITTFDNDVQFPVTADPRYNGYFADCGITTCTRWVDVSITKNIHDNRFNSTIANWGLVMGANCAPFLIFTGPGGVACSLLGAALITDLVNNLEQAAQRGHCLKIKYSRQLGFGVPLDFDDTDPSSSKCYL